MELCGKIYGMILPILAYGNASLKKECENITGDFPDLANLVEDMWATMRNANGCGLSASQVGHTIRLFIVDSKTTYLHLPDVDKKRYFEKEDKGIAQVFINAKITGYSEKHWEDQEGCLSIPDLSQKLKRSWTITMEYLDTCFEKHVRTFSGATARMIQHEYDHTNGILYLDHLQPVTRKLMASKLKLITKGRVATRYPMKFI